MGWNIFRSVKVTWISRWTDGRITGERINGIYRLLIKGVYILGLQPIDILTIDPNFQQDIQVWIHIWSIDMSNFNLPVRWRL